MSSPDSSTTDVTGLYYAAGQLTLRYADDKYETYTLDHRFLVYLAEVLSYAEWATVRRALIAPKVWCEVRRLTAPK